MPVACLATAIMMWAFAFPGISIALEGLNAYELSFLRLVVAGALFLPLAWRSRSAFPLGRDLARACCSGLLLLAAYSTFLNLGEQRVSAPLAGLLISTSPVFTVLLQGRSRTVRMHVVGVSMLLVGAGMGLIGDSHRFSWSGAILVVLAAAAEALALEVQAPLSSKYSPAVLTAVGIWVSAIAVLPFAVPTLAQMHPVPARSLWAAVLLGIGPTLIAYQCLAYATRALTNLVVTASFGILPFLSALAALILMGTSLSPALLIGAVVVGAGIVCVAISDEATNMDELPPLPHG